MDDKIRKKIKSELFAKDKDLANHLELQGISDKLEKILNKDNKVKLEGFDVTSIKGDKGDMPVKGVDYYTKEELEQFKKDATPIKGEHYFTPEEIREFAKVVTPIKGKDYVDGKDGVDGLEGYSPVKGKDYFDGKDGRNGKDGSPDSPRDIADKINTLKGAIDYKVLTNIPVQSVKEIVKAMKSLDVNDRLEISDLRNWQQPGKGKLDQRWHGGGASALTGLSDVAITSPTDSQVLSYNSSTGKWINSTGGGGSVSPLTTKGDLYTFSTVNARLAVGTNGQVLSADSSTSTGLKWITASGTGSVTSVSVTTANGVSGSVATATTTPAITLTLGDITPTTVNGLTISTTTGVLTITNGKTLSVVKTMSFTAADDTGVYTLPTGTKTLLATDGAGTSLTGIPYTLTGTANQVILSAGTGNITFSLPQSIGTSSSPQFSTIELGAASDTTLSRSSAGVLAVEGVVIPSISSTNTFTNKRKQPRVFTTASTASLTPEIDTYDLLHVTALAANITINNSSTSTAADGEQLRIRLLDNGTARTITWGNSYVAKGGTSLPTTTTLSKNLEMLLEYNSSLSKWNLLSVAEEA